MHCLQTSGNCIRNVTADHFAGAAADEVADPRPYAEIIRQWSSLHPEFSFLPRKFKIASSRSEHDRAAMQIARHRPAAEAERGRRARLRGLCRRRPGPHADDRPQGARLPARGRPARLCRGDPAGLQSARPARQQVQGAHQDPGPRDRRRGDHAPDRGRVRRDRQVEPSAPARGRDRAHRGLFRAAGARREAGALRRRSRRPRPTAATSRPSRRTTSRRTRSRATASSPSR